MPARKSPLFSKSNPANLRSQQGKIPAVEMMTPGEENRRARAETPRTLNVYEKTGSYRFLRDFQWSARRPRTLKMQDLSQSCIAYRNDKKKGC
jgi:hypothetical protein